MPQKRYAAVLGRNKALSAAELAAIGNVSPLNAQAVFTEISLEQAERLGGTTKFVELAGTAATTEEAITALSQTVESTTKVSFGISVYGSAPANSLAKSMKRALKERGISARFVLGKQELSTAQVHHNRLIGDGYEWCLFETPDGWHYGRTVWIPDFEGFARRDYKKPRSDAKRGMLPPQLARTMVNLATRGDASLSVLDPFCGVGGLLLESVTLGHQTVGSDVDRDAIDDARKNLEWLDGKAQWELAVTDAATELPKGQPGAIATEGTLGAAVRHSMTDADLEAEAERVAVLLKRFFKQAAGALQPGGRLVITLPAWKLHSGLKRLELVDQVTPLGYTVIRPLPKGFSFLEATDRDSIDVSRPNQRVIHELFIFERN